MMAETTKLSVEKALEKLRGADETKSRSARIDNEIDALDEETRRMMGEHHWRPGFVDYLFLAFNTSTAFSPTDVPALSRWAKVLMMLQASISLATLALLAARAVNILT